MQRIFFLIYNYNSFNQLRKRQTWITTFLVKVHFRGTFTLKPSWYKTFWGKHKNCRYFRLLSTPSNNLLHNYLLTIFSMNHHLPIIVDSNSGHRSLFLRIGINFVNWDRILHTPVLCLKFVYKKIKTTQIKRTYYALHVIICSVL